MRKQILRITAWVTACALCLFSFQGFAENGNSTVDIDVWMNILSDLSEKKTESPDENITYQTEPSDEYMPYQMTMDDIQALNPGSTVIDIYNNDGYLSLLVGKFYEGKVTNMEEGIESILGMATMLGFGKGCAFYCIYKSHNNNNGYTFYTYQQRYGGYTLRNATLRVAVDPEGYTAGLSCSFIPNVGTESQDPVISAKKAEQIVRQEYASLNLNVYSGRTVRMALPFLNRIFNCWVVYTDNPYATASFDMPYLEHFVTTDGIYLRNMPVNVFAGDRDTALGNTSYFDVMTVETYRTKVILEDGSERSIEVPVSYNANDGKYYLMDPSRKIAVAQYYDFNYLDYSLNFVTSDTIDGWSQNNLLAYANYIIMYDFYADYGIRSVDGFETPILITVGWCDGNHNPVDNACFYGLINGWACFGVSDINHMSDCLDFVGHEYTHGYTSQSMQGSLYENATGAINEAYSDIIGNLAEMSLGYTEDTDWLIGEKTGTPYRSMSNPNEYSQPAFVGDRFYKAAVLAPDSDLNDNGGVHDNCSLLGHIAWKMDQTGLSRAKQISMWLMAVEMLTPCSDYSDLHGALLFSMKINGLKEYGPAMNAAFEEAGFNEDWNKTYLLVEKEGCGRVTARLGGTMASQRVAVGFYTQNGTFVDAAYVDPDGTASALLPAGKYIAAIIRMKDNGSLECRWYTSSGWKTNGLGEPFTLKAGETMELPDNGQQKTGGSN